MEGITLTLLLTIALAVVFDYVNGFHDSANAIATSVATRALRPSVRGAHGGRHATSSAPSPVRPWPRPSAPGSWTTQTTTQAVVAAALVGAITWNLITWWLGLPSSCQPRPHRRAPGGDHRGRRLRPLNVDGIGNKVLIPMVTSPLIGFLVALLADGPAVLASSSASTRRPLAAGFRKAQVFSAGYMAFAHGSNDAQKTMGIITLALFAAGVIPDADTIPTWVIVVVRHGACRWAPRPAAGGS